MLCAIAVLLALADQPFVDHSFSCPVVTPAPTLGLCAAVCVADLADCPAELVCANPTDVKCADGNCYPDQPSCDAGVAANGDLCGEVCGLTCPQVITDMSDVCETTYAEFYESDYCATPRYIPYTKPGFIFFYVWVSVVGGLALIWCFVNQRLFPVEPPRVLDDSDENQELQTQSSAEANLLGKSVTPTTHTAFKSNLLASLLYVFVILTMIGFQVLYAVLCAMFYYTDSGETEYKNLLQFGNSEQALYVFQVAWHIGLAWSLVLKWPRTVISLFRRRCSLADAEYVVVFQPTKPVIHSRDSNVIRLQNFISSTMAVINFVFAQLFSDTIFLSNQSGIYTDCPVFVLPDGSRNFMYNYRKFTYNPETKRFELVTFTVAQRLSDHVGLKGGLTKDEAGGRLLTVGKNSMDVPAPTVFGVLLTEFTKPFYLYQNFMAWTWFNFYYWHMGIVNTGVYVAGGLSIALVSYRNQQMLHDLAKVTGVSKVLRDGEFTDVDQENLVPGDVVRVTPGPVFCDMVLIEGSLLMDESSLTGESMPVAKVQVDNTSALYSAVQHKKSTVFAGTTVLNSGEAMERNLAVVVKTGASASRGGFLRTILTCPAPLFKFDVQVKFVIVILLIYAIVGFIITLDFLNTDPVSAWFYAMYVVGTGLPPLLPTVFVVSVGIGAQRLRERGVICSNPQRILNAGKVRVACFDKTGTLTRQGLDFHSVFAAAGNSFTKEQKTLGDNKSAIGKAMASAHSLSQVSLAGQQPLLIGTSVDIKMFETVGWKLEMGGGHSPDKVTCDNQSLTLTKRFDFDHHRMTMSSFALDSASGAHTFFLKGSAESVRRVCDPASIPGDYDQVSEQLSRSGCYVLAIASRAATQAEEQSLRSGQELDRDQCESNLSLLGLITFRNELKDDTAEALRQLREGAVRNLMITGDHPLTAMFIARQSGLIPEDRTIYWAKKVSDHGEIEWLTEQDQRVDLPTDIHDRSDIELVVTGEVFHNLQTTSRIAELLPSIRVFARMSPNDKVSVVNLYVDTGMITLMCGDGGNDCGALRAAHVGVALSDAEASVVSPFTGLSRSCMSVVDVLLVGRSCLASALSSYKYMIMYGQVETINQIINAWFSITFAEWNWMFMDGFWMVTMAFTLPFSFPAKKLADVRPPSSLLGAYTLSSVLGVLALNFLFLVMALGILFEEDWFQCRKWEEGSVANPLIIGDNYESSVIYLVSGAQYFTSAMAFNFGFKHRAGWLYNWKFAVTCAVFIGLHIAMTMQPSKLSCFVRVNCEGDDILRGVTSTEKVPIQNPFNTTVMPHSFREKIVAIMIGNGAALMFWEYFVVNGAPGRWFRRRFPNTTPLKL